MLKGQLNDSWTNWLGENLERGCDPEQLLSILTQNGFSLESIKEVMGVYDLTRSSAAKLAKGKSSEINHKAIAETRLTQSGKCPKATRFPSDMVQLYTIEGFMSHDECDAISAIICKNLRPSNTTRVVPYYRTSTSSDLGLLKSDMVDAIDENIARTLGIRLSYSEGLQGQYYSIGQEFKQHTDFFEPGTTDYADEHCVERGNRTWTFMVYLNDVLEGGGTYFVKLGHISEPEKGKAIAWNNLYRDGRPNYDTLHAGMPVEEGHKVIITKWFRERGSGPMFYPE